MADVVATEPDQSGQDGRAPHRQDLQRLTISSAVRWAGRHRRCRCW
ncbi:hypothetical protein HMPREF9056_01062 [Actinomyces sp. oral taxon 170 str. F0386]|nr:hypothetical protein HMPREF9056_01062 [Actinomyces sp. oral taxon 170 str. F0386]